MTDQFAYSFPWPLQGYEGQEPLSEYVRCMETDIPTPTIQEGYMQLTRLYPNREKNADGKSLRNPQHGIPSRAYEEFPDPLTKGRRGGFDIHIYHFQVR